jgi:hypothetical protein
MQSIQSLCHDRVLLFSGWSQVVDAVKVPVIAAGGIGDARGIAAAFALGAATMLRALPFVALKAYRSPLTAQPYRCQTFVCAQSSMAV